MTSSCEPTARVALLQHPAVDDCVVVGREIGDGTVRVAYVARTSRVDADELSAHLVEARVPVPDLFVFVVRVPYQPDGQVDVAALTAEGIPDDLAARLLEQSVSRVPGVRLVAAVQREPAIELPPWYADDLDAGRQTRVAEVASPSPLGLDQVPDSRAGALAVADGGPLPPEDPGGPRVLCDALRRAASAGGQSPGGLTYVQDDGRDLRESYADLLARSERVAAALHGFGLRPGDRVLLLLSDHREFLAVFWGSLLGGFVPVPVAVPVHHAPTNMASQAVQGAWRATRPAAVVTTATIGDIEALTPAGQHCPVVSAADLRSSGAAPAHTADPDDLALLMMTSGSTGEPKAVMLSHRNLLARTRGSRAVNQFTGEDVSVNWMPLDHVAGLIYFHIRDVYLAAHQVHVPTSRVVQDPLAWLEALDRYRATVTFAPNFAYGLVLDREAELGRRRFDLSSVRAVLNGAEAIVAATARRFLQVLGPHGLRPDAMRPAWGMSETSSGVTYDFAFSRETSTDEQPFVPVGRPIPSCQMRIVDDEDHPVLEGEVGRLQVRGGQITAGYFGAPALTREAFTDDGWFKTGDLGLVRGGVLTVTGREKDVVVVNSVKYHSHAIEAVVESIPGVVPSFTAACAVRRPGADTDALAVFFVSKYEDPTTLADLVRRVRSETTSRIGVSPDFVLSVPSAAIPKTSLGKIQRTELARRLMAGELDTCVRAAERLLDGEHTVPGWFFRRVWMPKGSDARLGMWADESVILVQGSTPLGVAVERELRARGARVIVVDAAVDWLRVFTDLAASGPVPRHVIQLEEYGPLPQDLSEDALERFACRGALGLVGLARAAEAFGPTAGPFRLTCVASRVHRVSPGDDVVPARATTVGLLKSLAQECPWIQARHLDLADHDVSRAARVVVEEHDTPGSDREVAYREGRRLVARLAPAPLAHRASPLEVGGHYLITGGAGGIGAQLAAFLMERYQASVLLMGRRRAEDGPAQLVERLRRSGDVAYASVDVADERELETVVAEHERRWGRPLDGAFHLAGAYREGRVADESESSLSALLRPKVRGTASLHRLLEARGGGLLVSWASVAGVFGGAGVGAYAAANAFQRAYAEWAMDHGRVTHLCLEWSTWVNTGQSAGYPSQATRARGYLPMPPAKALASLMGALTASESLVIGLDAANRHVRRMLLDDGPAVDRVALYFEDDGTASVDDVTAAAIAVDRFGRPIDVAVTRLPSLPKTESGEVDVARLATWGSEDRVPTGGDGPRTDTERRLEALWCRALSLATLRAGENFFDCGGDSLSAVRLAGLVRDEFAVALPLRAIFEAGGLAEMARRIDAAPVIAPKTHARPAPATVDPALPLSAGQRSLWFIQALAPRTASLNIAFTARVVSKVAPAALRSAFQALVERHASLRTVFPAEGGVPIRRVLTSVSVPFEQVDASGWSEAEVTRAIATEIDRPFDLAVGPLVRVRLFHAPDGPVYLAVTFHHIVMDGWSLWECLAQLPDLYVAATRQTPSQAVPAEDEFSQFVRTEAEMVAGAAGKQHLDFWRAQLGDGVQPMAWPADRPRPNPPTLAGDSCRFRLGPGLTRRLKSLARASQCTVPTALLAVFEALLHRYSGQEEVVVGYLASGRSQGRFDSLVGYLANPLALSSVLSGDTSYAALLRRTRDRLLDALEHEDFPFPLVVEHLAPPRDASRTPLFQALFVFEKPHKLDGQGASAFAVGEPGIRMALGPLEFESLSFAAQREGQFDLTLVLAELEDDLVVSFDYRTELFDRATVEECAGHFRRLAERVATDPTCDVIGVDILSPDERAGLVAVDTPPIPFRALPFHQLVADHAARSPDAVAAVFENQALSYSQLQARARALGRVLRSAGVSTGTRVGLCAGRSLDLVVGVLGILEAGGAFVPLDPSYPDDRLAYMFADAQVSVLVTQQALASRCKVFEARRVYIDALPVDAGAGDASTPVSPGDVAYVIYTSGSSGRPKGVLVEHRGLANVAGEQQHLFGVAPGWRVLQFASISFDAFVFELAMALASGATLHLARPEDLLPGPPLLETLRREQISIATLPPSALQSLPSAPLPDLRVLTVAGEACGADLVERWAPGRAFFNLYGPTETTIWATAARCEPGAGKPTIGRAIANTQAYILDDRGHLVPRGVAGELHLGGVGLARGYHNQPELTARAFVPHALGAPGTRLYRTGDRVRRLANGALEFLGRVDSQVKVRGFRVELGEVEAILNQHPDVEQAAAMVRGDGSAAHIVAYVVPRAGVSPPSHALRTFLRARLPEYMVPSVVSTIDALPLSPAGKIDRKRLPEPSHSTGVDAPATPSSAVEADVAAVWAAVLRLDRVGLDDNFFDLGGTSLLVAQLHARLDERAPGVFSMVDLFSLPTVRAQAGRMAGSESSDEEQPIEAALTGRDRLRAQAARRASVEAQG